MFTWPEIVLLVLKLANAIMGEVNNQRQFTAGQDAEIAKISAAILRKTAAGKAMLEKVNALSDDDVDVALRGLEPK
ncbi:cell division protein FtsX [Bradyrhizobium sp. GM0.4]